MIRGKRTTTVERATQVLIGVFTVVSFLFLFALVCIVAALCAVLDGFCELARELTCERCGKRFSI